MQPSAHRIPESADGKQGNQGDDDNPADRENDSGPGQGKWTAKIAVNKQAPIKYNPSPLFPVTAYCWKCLVRIDLDLAVVAKPE